MENLGAICILLVFCLALYAIAAAIAGRWRRNRLLLASAERAVYAVWLLVTVASAVLVQAFLMGDYRFAYVAANSNRAMAWSYKLAAWWGGQEGSLLFWSWLLACYSAAAVFLNRRRHQGSLPWAIAILMTTQAFFLLLNAFVVSPFRVLAQRHAVVAAVDGMGLNPLLQYPLMRIHPPVLYLGYVGMTVPFAFAAAALIEREKGAAWIRSTRRWSLVTWLFQGAGVVLGARWAYAALGWGGYWSWDPVENASLLPWLSSTAFLHSVMIEEKRGMMKIWNAVLVSGSFFLCIFGTMMTRSGMVNSVHAFARSSIGNYFLGFLVVGIAATGCLILARLDFLKSESELGGVLSRESAFLFNNLILLASCFAVLWGTLFPVISEYAWGEKISLDGTWFNRVMIPIGLFLLLLTGVGPLFAWRRSSAESLRRNFQIPGAAACLLAAALLIAGMRNTYALISFALCLFVAWTVAAEFWRGARVLQRKHRISIPAAMIELTRRNTRRYGGYLVHMGMVLMFIGFTGSAFNRSTKSERSIGESVHLGRFELKIRQITEGETDDYLWQRAEIDIYRNQEHLGTLKPERQYYKASRQPIGRVDIRQRPGEDLYVNFAGVGDSSKAVIEAYLFPLVGWIWIGALMLAGGTLVALLPPRRPAQLDSSRTSRTLFNSRSGVKGFWRKASGRPSVGAPIGLSR